MDRSPDTRFAIALGAITLIGPLSIHLFLPAIPTIKAEFAISDALATFTFSITLMTMAFMTLIYGNISDRYGRRPVLLIGLVFFIAGSAATMLASSVPTLIAGRLLQAIGAGCGVTLARAIARDAYGPERLVKAIAYLTMAYAIGPMIATPLGGAIIDVASWRSVFLFALLAGLAILAGAFIIIPETHRKGDRQTQGNPLKSYARLMRQPRFAAYVLQSAFQSGAFYALATASPFLATEYLHLSAGQYGIYFLFFSGGYCLGNWISSRLSGKVDIDTMVLIGSLMFSLTVLGQAIFTLTSPLTTMMLFIPGFLISVAQGLSLPNGQAGAMRVALSLSGSAAGIGVFLQIFCSAAFAQIYGFLADGTPVPLIWIEAGGSLFALVAGIYVYVTRSKPAGNKPAIA
jgi:DHA1 family bicyclomycin/chloramphenicol resistance-like MFS transporter